jgi:hypothetical protein
MEEKIYTRGLDNSGNIEGFFIFRLREVPLTPGRGRWMSISQ